MNLPWDRRAPQLRRHLSFSVTVITILAISIGAWAQPKKDPYDLPEPVAIQNRRYRLPQSLLFSAGFIPTDTFNRGFPLSLSYRRDVSSFLGWEVVNYAHVFNAETRTKKDLRDLQVDIENVGLEGKLDYPYRVISTGFHYSPLYSKSLLFNSSLIYGESSLYLGAGTLFFKETGVKPTLIPGMSGRYYLSPRSAFTYYLKFYAYNDTVTGLNAIMDFGIGYEFGANLFGGGATGDDAE